MQTVDKGAQDVLIALSCGYQLIYEGKQLRSIAFSELFGPTRVCFVVEALVAVDWKESQVASGCDFLALCWQGVSGYVENGVEEEQPAFDVLKVPEVEGDGDVEWGVEGFEYFWEQSAGGFVEIAQDLFYDLLQSGEKLVDEDF